MLRTPAPLLFLLALVGLVLPPTQVVHAHEDGHAPHGHGPAHVVHVAIHGGHVAIHGHGHGTHDADHGPDAPRDGEDVPESHFHGGPVGALARPRLIGSGPDSPVRATLHVAPVASCGAVLALPVERGAPAAGGADPDGGPSRALDLLLAIGRLLL